MRDTMISRGISVWEKQHQVLLCTDWKGISACPGIDTKGKEEKVALDYAHALGNNLTQRLSFIMFLLHQAHKPFLFYVRFDVRYHEA